MALFDQIKQLYDNELYGNLVELLNILLPQLTLTPESVTPNNHFQIIIYYGDALYQTNQFSKAEVAYQKALLLRKNINKNKRKSQTNGSFDLTEIDIKYKIYLCYHKMEEYTKAISILEEIPAKNRNVKINMALGEMYKLDKSIQAINCFKEVLKESPFSISTIINLIKLEVKVPEIFGIISPMISNIPQMSWLTNWIRAQAYIYSSNVSHAIPILKQMVETPLFKDNVETPLFKDNVEILISLGESHYHNGDYKSAINDFKKAYCIDPLTFRGMDYYASCLAKENRLKELESLSNDMIKFCESNESSKFPEPWLVLAYYCFLTSKRESKAFYFVQKACLLSNNSVESLLLKGAIMLEAKSNQEATNCFQEAFNKAQYRFETMKSLVEIYLIDKRKSHALNTANYALRTLSSTPRTLTLYASALLFEPSPADKKAAKSALEKALKIDPWYLEAAYKLANIFYDEKNYDKAIEILLRAIDGNENNAKIHKMLSECYGEKNEQDKAMHHKALAAKLESSNRNTTDISQIFDQHIAPNGIEPTLELEVDEMPPSDDDIDSETDVIWSDDN